jgi:hypothetical protein
MDSYEKKPYCRAHLPTFKATTISDDFHTKANAGATPVVVFFPLSLSRCPPAPLELTVLPRLQQSLWAT